MRKRSSSQWWGFQKDTLIRYVRFEILRARGERYDVAYAKARISPVTVRRWRIKLGLRPGGDGRFYRFRNEVKVPVRGSRYTHLRKVA